MKKLNALAAVLALLLATSAFAYAPTSDPDDPLPWPWGTECPFPWHNIEGIWMLEGKQAADQFQFRVISVWDNGTHVFEINRYDKNGQLVGKGQGIAPSGQRIVRAIMYSVLADGFVGERYKVIVRAYKESENITCSGELITVLTIRPLTGSGPREVHYIINKLAD